MSNMNKQLHWTQRIALVRHNLHSASRSGDFGFFKSLLAAGLIEGSNHVATLSASLGEEADTLLAALDNLNAGLACIHQDAFENVYKSLKSSRKSHDSVMSLDSDRCKTYVDTTMQKNMANMAIDKTTNSATALINQQPAHVQECAANVWITGVTIISDSMEVALQQMDSLECKLDDFIRLEDSWETVKNAVACSTTAMKAVFQLMDVEPSPVEDRSPRASNASFASATGSMFRRMSSAFSSGPSPTSYSSVSQGGSVSMPASRTSSFSSAHSMPIYRMPQYARNSASQVNTFSIPEEKPNFFHRLSIVPATPGDDDETDPFDNSVPLPPAIVDNGPLSPRGRPMRMSSPHIHTAPLESPLRVTEIAS